MSLSPIQSLPSEVVGHLFTFLPPSNVATSCRFVCKTWNTTTKECVLWQEFAKQLNLFYIVELCKIQNIENQDIARKEIEKQVQIYLRFNITISTKEELAKKIASLFSNIPTGQTRALKYCSASNPQAFGYYLKSNDPKTPLFNAMLEIAKDKEKGEKLLEFLLKQFEGLTITGKDTADLQVTEIGACSYNLGIKQIVIQRHLSHEIELKYLN